MTWYVFSLIALFSNVGFVLTQKWALNKKVNHDRWLLSIFMWPFLVYLALDFRNLGAIGNAKVFVALGFLAALFSFFANISMVKANAGAPSTAYPTAINNARTIIVIVASALFFGSHITVLNVLMSMAIVLGLLLINYKKPDKNAASGGWQVPAFSAMLLFAGMILVVKYITVLGFRSMDTLVILFGFVSFGYAVVNFLRKDAIKLAMPAESMLAPTALAVIFVTLANYANFRAIGLAPNPGYSEAVTNGQAAVVLFLSPLFFPAEKGGEIDLRRAVGVIIIVISIVAIVFNKN